MTKTSAMNYFVHEKGICESNTIGAGTKVWAFAHVLPDAQVGSDCNICDGVFIENDVIIGDRVTVKCGVQLWDGLRIADDVFIGPNATFTNDKRPMSKIYPDEFLQTHLEQGCSIGANATILPGVKVGKNAMVGAAAVVTKDVPPYATVVGNPARIVGYQATGDTSTSSDLRLNLGKLGPKAGDRLELPVAGAYVERIPHFDDMRGSLSAMQNGLGAPFVPVRVFIVHGVPTNDVRGEHAHKSCQQFLVASHGSVTVMMDDGVNRSEFTLEDPSMGVYLPPEVWGVQYKFSPDCALVVLASEEYEADDYIRSYDDFLDFKRASQ